jgi:hypothetical protein
MYKPSEGGTARWARRHAALIALAVLAVLIPVTALSGLLDLESGGRSTAAVAERLAEKPAEKSAEKPADKAPKAGANYRIRCWQDGRLLFEQDEVALPSDLSPYSVKLRGTDREGRPIYLTDSKNATCLVQLAPARERARMP